jgi:hypothetical protein
MSNEFECTIASIDALCVEVGSIMGMEWMLVVGLFTIHHDLVMGSGIITQMGLGSLMIDGDIDY